MKGRSRQHPNLRSGPNAYGGRAVLTGVWNAAHQIGINAEGSVESVSPGSRTGWRMSSFEVKPVRTASGGAEREMAVCCVEGSTAWNVGVGPGWAHHFSVSARCSKWTWAKGSESKRGVWLIQTSVSGLLLLSQGCSSSLAHTEAASVTDHRAPHTLSHRAFPHVSQSEDFW